MKDVKLIDKEFEIYITEDEISSRVQILSNEINEYFEQFPGEVIQVIVMMNGAFLFGADLVRRLKFPLQMHFLKSSSYVGLVSTGKVDVELPKDLKLDGERVLIIEDIVDTGKTFAVLLDDLIGDKPKDLQICSLLVKNKNPDMVKRVKFAGFKIEDPFVVGYGMDYDGHGRDLADIYVIK